MAIEDYLSFLYCDQLLPPSSGLMRMLVSLLRSFGYAAPELESCFDPRAKRMQPLVMSESLLVFVDYCWRMMTTCLMVF